MLRAILLISVYQLLTLFTSSISTTTTNVSSSTNVCQNVWKFPPNCLGNCTYQLVWRFKPVEDAIEFIVSSKHAQRWTGVGFAQDKSLTNSDAIFAWIEDNSRYVMMDAFLPTYQTPISDKQQSISNISATVSNGLISFRFTRRRNTGDSLEDLLFSDEKCLYLFYPVEGGSVDVKNRAVITSEYAPQISNTPICIRACNYKPPGSSTPAPTNPLAATPEPQPTSPLVRPSLRPRPSFANSSLRPSTTSTSTPSTFSTTTSTTSTTTTPKPTTTARPVTSTTSTTTTTSTTPKPTTTSTTTSTTTTTTTQRPTTTTTTTTSTTTTQPPTTTTTTTTSLPSTTTTTSAPPSSSTTSSPQEQLVKAAASNISPKVLETDGSEQQWCVGRWSHPANCRFQPRNSAETISYLQQTIDSSTSIRPLPLELSDCSYYAQWKYLEETDSIEFIIQTKTRYKWTGIGFSNGTKMANSDAIIGIFDEVHGRHFIMDTWLEDHVMPKLDANQSAEQTWAKRENQITTFKFQRKRITNDQFDFQFTDDSCAYFFFPTQGGPFNPTSKRLNRHDVVPSVSKHKICIKSCTNKNGNNLPPLTTSSGDSENSSSSQSPNLLLLSSSTSSSTSPSSTSSPTTPEKNLDSTNPVNLSPSNDLNAELDTTGSATSASSASTSPSGQQTTLASSKLLESSSSTHPNTNTNFNNPFNRLTFLSEPSIRWLAGIGCVATLLAMIVFQACFTVYKNKQAYKQNLYRQSAFNKQAACLGHTNPGLYVSDSGSHHQPSTGSDETQIASLHNNGSSSGARSAAAAAVARSAGHAAMANQSLVPPPPLTIRSHHQRHHQQQHQQAHHRHHQQQYYQQQQLQHYQHSHYPKQHHHHHQQQEARQHHHNNSTSRPHHHHHNHAATHHQHAPIVATNQPLYSSNSQHRQHSQLATAATAGGVPYDLLRHHAHQQRLRAPICDEFTTSSQTDYSEQEDDEELDEEVFDEEENYYAARRARLYYN